MTINREQTISLAMLALLLAFCAALVQYAMQERADAARELVKRQEMVAQLEARAAPKGQGRANAVAPATAFVDAPTPGLAGAQLQAHLAQIASAQRASFVSSGLEPTKREDPPDTIRLQATIEVGLVALQAMLYRLESGTPYVFVDALTIRPAATAAGRPPEDPLLQTTLSVRAFWRRSGP